MDSNVCAGRTIRRVRGTRAAIRFRESRAGFEIRTHRLCQRILVAHRMPERLGQPRERSYATSSSITTPDRSAHAWRTSRNPDIGYSKKDRIGVGRCHRCCCTTLPSPLDDPTPREWKVEQLPRESLENLPTGVAGQGYQWTDLDGEGIAGVLAEESGAWYYKPNRGHGQFGSVQVVRTRPVGEGGRSQLIDLDSDGRLELATLVQGTGGYFDRTDEEGWTPFRPFRSSARRLHQSERSSDRFSGDGLADILIMDDQAITWHPSLGDLASAKRCACACHGTRKRGPRVLFGQADQTVFLADMSGDGLPISFVFATAKSVTGPILATAGSG